MTLQRLNAGQFKLFREFIYEKSGIRVDSNKMTLLSNRIRRRLTAGSFEGFDDYYQFLTSAGGAEELAGFLAAVTTNETFFFRTLKHFEWLASEWLTEQVRLHRSGQRKPELRICSAGCANGAEPYSIAICLAENSYRLRDWKLEVVGIDISQQMLDEARTGKFKARAMEAVSERRRRRYFQNRSDENVWEVRQPIRDMVEFNIQNLMQPLPGPQFDCIFIRNVLIYFDNDSKQAVAGNLLDALVTGGYLVLGPSEGVQGMLNQLQRISPLVFKKVDDGPQSLASGSRGVRQ